MVTAQCSITIYSLVVCARTLTQVDLYINVLHTVRCYGRVFVCKFERVCARLWACVCGFERVCTMRLTSGAVVYGVATVINTTQFAWRQRPDELGDQWWGVCRLACKTKRRTRSAGFHLSLALVVGPFSFFVFVFVLLFLKYIHTYIFLFLF